MIDVREYILLVMKKKHMSRSDLLKKLNEIEEKIGDSRSNLQNITNYLNGYNEFGPKLLVRYEKALNLPIGTLVNMISRPVTKESQKELKEIIEKVGKL